MYEEDSNSILDAAEAAFLCLRAIDPQYFHVLFQAMNERNVHDRAPLWPCETAKKMGWGGAPTGFEDAITLMKRAIQILTEPVRLAEVSGLQMLNQSLRAPRPAADTPDSQ